MHTTTKPASVSVANYDGIKASDTMTVPAFLKRAERMIREANSDVAATLEVTWIVADDDAVIRRYRDRSGRPGMAAYLQVEAPGHRTRRMLASWSPDGMMVR